MAVLLKNNAVSRLGANLTNAATSLSVTAGDGAKFPSPTGGDWFPLTLVKADGTLEVVRCTARNGDVLTIARAQEGTAAAAFAAGDRAELRITALALAQFGQLSSQNAWTQAQVFQAMTYAQQAINIDNGTADSPELYWYTPSYRAFADLYNGTFRIHGYKGATDLGDMIGFNMDTKIGYIFGGLVWTSANFNPNDYLNKGAKAADSELLDGVDGVEYLRRRITNYAMDGTYFNSSSPPYIAAIGGDQPALTIGNDGNQAASAVIQFHRQGSYAAYFGLDTDNVWKVGGRSMGQQAFPIWHDGMDTVSRVKGSMAVLSTGDIGTPAFLQNVSGNQYNPGDVVGGSVLRWSSHNVATNNAPVGNWRCMGHANNGGVTVWVRVN